jgi:DNA-binding transcriptional regulator YiaG
MFNEKHCLTNPKAVFALERLTAPFKKELETREIRLEVTSEEIKKSRFSPRLIKSLRKHLGITQKELAILMGISIGAVQKWEAGNSRPADSKKHIIVALRKLRRRDIKRLLEKRSAVAVQNKRKFNNIPLDLLCL